eukprot:9499-Heterococcus_DN1.PRE.2
MVLLHAVAVVHTCVMCAARATVVLTLFNDKLLLTRYNLCTLLYTLLQNSPDSASGISIRSPPQDSSSSDSRMIRHVHAATYDAHHQHIIAQGERALSSEVDEDPASPTDTNNTSSSNLNSIINSSTAATAASQHRRGSNATGTGAGTANATITTLGHCGGAIIERCSNFYS